MRSILAAAFVVLAGVSTTAAPPQDALAQLREALGGDAVINAVETIRARGKIKFKPHDDHFDIAVAFPDRFVSVVRTFRWQDAAWSTGWGYYPANWEPRLEPMLVGGGETTGEQRIGFNGAEVLTTSRVPITDAGVRARMLDARLAKMIEFLLPLLGGAGTASSQLVVARPDAHAINFSAVGGREWRLELDPVSHLPARMLWIERPPWSAPASARPVAIRMEFSDFRVVAGLRWPHRIVTHRDGRSVEEATIQRYDVNGKLSDKLFRE